MCLFIYFCYWTGIQHYQQWTLACLLTIVVVLARAGMSFTSKAQQDPPLSAVIGACGGWELFLSLHFFRGWGSPPASHCIFGIPWWVPDWQFWRMDQFAVTVALSCDSCLNLQSKKGSSIIFWSSWDSSKYHHCARPVLRSPMAGLLACYD